MAEEARWISLAEALELHFRRLGFPEPAVREFLVGSVPHGPGIMWLSDLAIMVYDSPLGLAFDRNEFDAVISQVKPINVADA